MSRHRKRRKKHVLFKTSVQKKLAICSSMASSKGSWQVLLLFQLNWVLFRKRTREFSMFCLGVLQSTLLPQPYSTNFAFSITRQEKVKSAVCFETLLTLWVSLAKSKNIPRNSTILFKFVVQPEFTEVKKESWKVSRHRKRRKKHVLFKTSVQKN